MEVDRPYGEFYEFYSVSPEYFGYTLVQGYLASYINTQVKSFNYLENISYERELDIDNK
jgi:hypothetical protein